MSFKFLSGEKIRSVYRAKIKKFRHVEGQVRIQRNIDYANDLLQQLFHQQYPRTYLIAISGRGIQLTKGIIETLESLVRGTEDFDDLLVAKIYGDLENLLKVLKDLKKMKDEEGFPIRNKESSFLQNI